MLAGCGTTDSGEAISLDGSWNFAGLEGVKINVLEPDEDGILVGTGVGLFKWKEDEFVSVGLVDYELRGMTRLKNNNILATVMASGFSSGDTTIFKSKNNGDSWGPYLNNFGGDEGKYTWIDSGPKSTNPPSDTIFIRGSVSTIRSLDGGQSWEALDRWNAWGGSGVLLYIDPYQSKRIWAGGVSALSQAYLWKSVDNGESWENVSDGLSHNVEGVAYDVVTHSGDADKVLTGLGGGSNRVMKSTDGGENWEMVLENTAVHTFARSPQNPNLIYASGRDVTGKLFFAYTSNFGDTWEKQIFEEGSERVATNDMDVMMIDGKEVIFFGTDKGLYTYEVEN